MHDVGTQAADLADQPRQGDDISQFGNIADFQVEDVASCCTYAIHHPEHRRSASSRGIREVHDNILLKQKVDQALDMAKYSV
jgi:hypothetical protein